MLRQAGAFGLALWYVAVALLAQAPPASVVEKVKLAYLHYFDLSIPHPAIYNNPESVDCLGRGHLTTTAYRKTTTGAMRLFTIYMSRDGTEVLQAHPDTVSLRPFGTIRVLVLLLHYPETVSDSGLVMWEAGQRQINEDHAAFARSRGYSAPIVVFDNTNVLVDPTDIGNPHDLAAVRRAAALKGFATNDFQIVMAIDVNPRESAGGFSILSEKFVYVGNYFNLKSPLDAAHWKFVAGTAYHHEVAHHWGWPGTHDWSGGCGGAKPEYTPFIVPPVLFGWEDLDGDHVPDILNEITADQRR